MNVNVKVNESLVTGGWLAPAERGPTEDWDLERKSGRSWIRTSEGVEPADLQSAPFGHFGIRPGKGETRKKGGSGQKRSRGGRLPQFGRKGRIWNLALLAQLDRAPDYGSGG